MVSIFEFLKNNINTLNEMISLYTNDDEMTDFKEKELNKLLDSLKWNKDTLKRAEKDPWGVTKEILDNTEKALENINKKLRS